MTSFDGWPAAAKPPEGCRKVKRSGSASSKGWAKSLPLVGIGLTDPPKIRGGVTGPNVPPPPVPASLPDLHKFSHYLSHLDRFTHYGCLWYNKRSPSLSLSEPVENLKIRGGGGGTSIIVIG